MHAKALPMLWRVLRVPIFVPRCKLSCSLWLSLLVFVHVFLPASRNKTILNCFVCIVLFSGLAVYSCAIDAHVTGCSKGTLCHL